MTTTKDLAVLQAMTAQLSDYLLSDVEFWPLGGRSDFPQLSLGAYLLVRQRLTAATDQRAEVTALCQRGDATLAQWQAAAERKAAKELRTRVNLWRRYLANWQGRYATEVTQRVIAALLLRQFSRLAATPDAQHLAALDARLHGRATAAGFVWLPELEPAFPADDFWFLYHAAP